MLQRVVVCCKVLQCVAVCCSVLQCAPVCLIELQNVAAWQCVTVSWLVATCRNEFSVLQRVAVY